jgi:hypothetical protein
MKNSSSIKVIVLVWKKNNILSACYHKVSLIKALLVVGKIQYSLFISSTLSFWINISNHDCRTSFFPQSSESGRGNCLQKWAFDLVLYVYNFSAFLSDGFTSRSVWHNIQTLVRNSLKVVIRYKHNMSDFFASNIAAEQGDPSLNNILCNNL